MLAKSGDRGDPWGLPRPSSWFRVVRRVRPRSSVSSTGATSHILISPRRCRSRRISRTWPKPNTDTGGEFIFLAARELGEDPRQMEKDTILHRTARGDPSPMSLRPQPPFAIPEETHRVAHAAFPKGTLCLRIADELGDLYRDDQFAALFPTRGQPAASPARLAWVTVLQYIEGLSDRQAAEAVRGRIDWKYALALELDDPGFNHTVLSEFRSRLVKGQAEEPLQDALLDHSRNAG